MSRYKVNQIVECGRGWKREITGVEVIDGDIFYNFKQDDGQGGWTESLRPVKENSMIKWISKYKSIDTDEPGGDFTGAGDLDDNIINGR
jgi:hypothetical protein